jgi:hypothetical protein
MFAPPVAKPKQSAPQSSAAARVPAQASPSGRASGAGWDFSAIPVQAKLAAPVQDDPLERAADAAADKVLAMPQPSPMRASARSSGGRGDALPAPAREFFEPRFGHDFGNVRVHHGLDAARSAETLGARAYTLGRNIVFGAGQYAQGSREGQHLLAHELAHVVQQSRGPKTLQRSPLSDAVQKDLGKDPKFTSVLARLGKDDVQNAQNDGDVDKLIDTLLSNPNDNAVAHQIRHGKLGDTQGWTTGAKKPTPRPVKAVFFQGTSDRRALVIAGVHGTETQGMEVADRLIADLQKPGNPPPIFSVIIVPRMFPDNDANFSREGLGAPPNRNFPDPSKTLEESKDSKGVPRAAPTGKKGTGAEILPENVMLIELMERFHPERIISIHGTWGPGAAGVFYDPISPAPEQVQAAQETAKGIDGGQELPPKLQERLERAHMAALYAGADQTNNADRDLSLDAAKQIDADTAGIAKTVPQKGGGTKTNDPRLSRGLGGSTKDMIAGRKAHPSVAGNVEKDGTLTNPIWSAGAPGGVSLGGYASKRGVSIFTVEPPMDAESARYPNGKDRATGDVDKLSKADRITELQAYADAVRTILLGK